MSSSYSSTSVTWYVAYINNCDITHDESLKNYAVLNNKDIIKDNKLFSKNFDETNIFPNGDGSDTSMVLPDGYSWDTTDVAGNAKASISIGVGAKGLSLIGGYMNIKPNCRYKLSCWVKCKGDMTNYLLGVPYYVDNLQISASLVFYMPGTLTNLTADLNPGDTTVSVASTANWDTTAGYRSLAFKSSI